MSTNPIAQDIAKEFVIAYLSSNEMSGKPENIAEFIATLYKEIYEKTKSLK